MAKLDSYIQKIKMLRQTSAAAGLFIESGEQYIEQAFVHPSILKRDCYTSSMHILIVKFYLKLHKRSTRFSSYQTSWAACV